jgi:hypothetical protein
MATPASGASPHDSVNLVAESDVSSRQGIEKKFMIPRIPGIGIRRAAAAIIIASSA